MRDELVDLKPTGPTQPNSTLSTDGMAVYTAVSWFYPPAVGNGRSPIMTKPTPKQVVLRQAASAGAFNELMVKALRDAEGSVIAITPSAAWLLRERLLQRGIRGDLLTKFWAEQGRRRSTP